MHKSTGKEKNPPLYFKNTLVPELLQPLWAQLLLWGLGSNWQLFTSTSQQQTKALPMQTSVYWPHETLHMRP